MTIIRFIMIFLFLFLVFLSFGATEEPKCFSRFDFEEKLLAKLVKLDHRMHLVQEKELVQNKRIEELEKRFDECTSYVHKLDSFLADINREIQSHNKSSVGFHALGLRNMSPKTGEKLVFWKAKINLGKGYDVNTGIFSVPVDGMYWFSTQICNKENLGMQFLITINDNPMTNSIQYGSSATCTSANMVAELVSGDQVFVQTGHIGGGGQVLFENVHRESMFSGMLVN